MMSFNDEYGDKMAATIKDVARVANVSVSTVSLVLNNSELVKMETKYKVLQAVKELGYTPNQYARSLVTKRKNIIGVALMTYNQSTNWFTFNGHVDTYLTGILPSIEKEINESNYSMLLEHFCSNNHTKELPLIMAADRVDGMLMAGGIVSEELLTKIQEAKIPTVLVGSRHENLDYVDTDPEQGIYLGTRYLIENGHTDIVFINGSEYSQSSMRKLNGFKAAMNEAKLELKEDWMGQTEYSGQSAYSIMRMMWDKGVRPTAILGGYDGITIGALRFLYDQGLRCPQDVSAIGFEDSILAEFCYPPLTTIKVHKEQMGLEACRVLLNRIKKPNAKAVKLIIEPALIVRQSVGKR
jgi:LacI family transcriptional regulator